MLGELVFDEEEGRGTVDDEPSAGTEDETTDEEVVQVLLLPLLSAMCAEE